MRVDGWKSIAAHFGRERSTVIRWASERGMPVHRIPGPGRGSVYALTEELDAWLATDRLATRSPASVQEPATEPIPQAPLRTDRRRLVAFATLGFVGLASLSAYALGPTGEPPKAQLLPPDADLAEIYLEGRADWARRSASSIASAIEKFQRVTVEEPDFVPGYVALADAYVLAREFGSMSDLDAFARAQAAADAALRIDPGDADALRVSGFIQYWWRGNPREALSLFRASLKARPDAAQTHFWFGNILIDNGDFAAGMAELERARLLEPASVPLQVDVAYSRWALGDEVRGERELAALAKRYPELATARDSYCVPLLAKGDIAGFVREAGAAARLRELPDEVAMVEQMEATLMRDPAQVLPQLLARMENAIAQGERTGLVWPAFIASAANDRASLVRLLEIGGQRGEKWGAAGQLRHIRAKWSNDREVMQLIEAVTPELLIQT